MAAKPSSGGGGSHQAIVAITLIAGVVLLIVLALIFTIARYPSFEVSVIGPESFTTRDGIIASAEFEFTANSPIENVYYKVSRDGDVDDTETAGESSNENERPDDEPLPLLADGEDIMATIVLPELCIEPGDSVLNLIVESSSGKKVTFEYPMTFDIGYSEPFEEDAVLELPEGTKLVSNELLVCLKDGVSDEEAKTLFAGYGGTIVGRIYIFGDFQVRFAKRMDRAALNALHDRLEQDGLVESVTYNFVMESELEAVTPNDTRYDSWDVSSPAGNNWGLEAIDAPGAWGYNNEMKSVKVGVSDSFVDIGHEDLKIPESHARILTTDDFPTYFEFMDYVDGGAAFSRPGNYKNHGTHVSGIIGARADNGTGVAGVNWFSEIYFTPNWYYTKGNGNTINTGDISYFSQGLNFAYLVASGCRVLNFSVGTPNATSPSPEEEDSIQTYERWLQTLENGGYDFLICKAAGNENDDAYNHHMNRVMTGGELGRAHTIVVGSIRLPSEWDRFWEGAILGGQPRYKKAYTSNYGDMVDLYAPGDNIFSTVSGNGAYDIMSGTSMASPVVAGVASLAYSINPDFDYRYVKRIVTNSATDFVEIQSRFYPIVNAATTVELSRMAEDVPPMRMPAAGFARGLVQDARTGELIHNAVVTFDNEMIWVVDIVSDVDEDASSGEYNIWLEQGTYTMTCSALGYRTETVYGVQITEGVVTNNVLLNMVGDADTDGTASGRVVNAFDASSIPNATMAFYRGLNNPGYEAVKTAISDSGGNYAVTLPPGNYTAIVSAEGYTKSSTNILIIPGEERGSQDCTLTPILNPGEIRFVLTWGHYPADLDSHLVGPSPNGRFHIYYLDMNYFYDNQRYDLLDVDDTTSYGPETTSVYVGVDGDYTFYVHDYTNRGQTSSAEISRSGAQVKVYVAGVPDAIVFNAPSSQGTLWRVCTIRNGEIIPINEMSYERDPGRVGR
jgi:hypothetical protein